MFYYFDFTVWFKLLRLVGKEKNERQRRGLYKLLLLHIPLRASVTAVCFFLDGILFPGLLPGVNYLGLSTSIILAGGSEA